jgi:ADP-dependent phosphofructokinase/glucokinase
MKDLELHATRLHGDDWLIELYNPNIASVEVEGTKSFSTVGAAQVWADTIGDIEKVFDEGETLWVRVPSTDREKTEMLLAL